MNTSPTWPIALSLFGHGTQLLICSDRCLDSLEEDRYPGIRFAHMTRRRIESPWCAVCAVCGKVCAPKAGCGLHAGECPDVQWRLTLQGLDAAATAFELFEETEAERLLEILERYLQHRPQVDPVILLMKLAQKR